MPVAVVLFWVLVIGVLVWTVNTYVKDYVWPPFLKIFNAIAVIGTVIWLLFVIADWMGVHTGFDYVPHLRR